MKRKFSKGKIVLGLACLLSVIPLAKAEEKNPVDSIVKDNVLYIDMFKPIDSYDARNAVDVINKQYSEFLKDDDTTKNKRLSFADWSDDFSNCTLVYESCKVSDGCGGVGTDVKVKWKEDSLETYSDNFKKITTNGVINLDSIKPNDEYFSGSWYGAGSWLDFAVSKLIQDALGDDYYNSYATCDETFSNCRVSAVKRNRDTGELEYLEEHMVKINFKEANPDVKKTVDEYTKTIKDNYNNGKVKSLTDLDLINYYYLNTKVDFSKINYYSPFLRELFNGQKVTFDFEATAGDSFTDFSEGGWGGIILSYDGIMYSGTNYGTSVRNVIYIPDDTEDTSEAFIKAAKKRIDAYLGENDITIEVAGPLSKYLDIEDEKEELEKIGDVTKMGDSYYYININGQKNYYLIEKASSKIEMPVVETKDAQTNITISTDSSDVPLDTTVEVKEVKEGSQEFDKVKEVLKVEKNEEVQVYDFKLFSKALDKYISKLENGEFKITVPIKDSLKGKKLAAYYIDGDKIEEHDVEVVDGFATFKTTHFSIYTIAAKRTILNGVVVPNTFDGIMTYLFIGLIGLIGLVLSLSFSKKKAHE